MVFKVLNDWPLVMAVRICGSLPLPRCFFLYFCRFVSLPFCLSVFFSFCQFVFLSFCLFVFLFVCLFVPCPFGKTDVYGGTQENISPGSHGAITRGKHPNRYDDIICRPLLFKDQWSLDHTFKNKFRCMRCRNYNKNCLLLNWSRLTNHIK